MRLWTVMCENWANWGTLTIWDWALLGGVTVLWLYVQHRWHRNGSRVW